MVLVVVVEASATSLAKRKPAMWARRVGTTLDTDKDVGKGPVGNPSSVAENPL